MHRRGIFGIFAYSIYNFLTRYEETYTYYFIDDVGGVLGERVAGIAG